MRRNTGSTQMRLAISRASSTLRPCNSPLSSTNCCGGSVGLIDICHFGASIRLEAGTFGVQVWAPAAWDRPTSRAKAEKILRNRI